MCVNKEEKVKVRVGYACINLSIKSHYRNYRLKTVEDQDEAKITDVIWSNMRLMKEIILHNIKHNIYVYRVTSDLIPFCTHPYVRALYKEKVLQNNEMQQIIKDINELRKQYDLRLTIHPSQFNVLSSPREDVVRRSIEEINAQTEWMKLIGGKNVVIHMGGVYNDKKEAIKRFERHLDYVDEQLISIENDDKTYNVEDVYEVVHKKRLKWVYDFHHNRCYPVSDEKVRQCIMAYPPDKYHLSTGDPNPNSRPHADYISAGDYEAFVDFLQTCHIEKADVIFEAKKKNKSIHHILMPLSEGYWQLEDH